MQTFACINTCPSSGNTKNKKEKKKPSRSVMRSLCGEKRKIVTLVLPVNPPTLALITAAASRHLYSAPASFAVMSGVSRLTNSAAPSWVCAPLQILINITLRQYWPLSSVVGRVNRPGARWRTELAWRRRSSACTTGRLGSAPPRRANEAKWGVDGEAGEAGGGTERKDCVGGRKKRKTEK